MAAVPIAMLDGTHVLRSYKSILDSGSTRHMTNRRDHFLDFTKSNGTIKIRNSEFIQSKVYGTLRVFAIVRGVINDFTLRNAFYVPLITYNLISVLQTRINDFQVIIDNNNRSDPKSHMLELLHKPSVKVKILGLKTTNELYESVAEVCDGRAAVASDTKKTVWRARLGHCSS